MENDRIIDFCKFISDTNRRAFQARKQHEWKVVFSVSTLYILSAALKIKESFQFPDCCWFYIAYGSVAFFTIIFLKFIHTANNTNKYIAHNAEHTIQNLLNGNDINKLDLFNVEKKLFPCKSLIKPGKGGLWDWLCKSALIAVVTLVSAIVITR